MDELNPAAVAATIQTSVDAVVAAEPQVATMADVGLDAAALAAENVAKVEGMKNPEVAAQTVVTMKDDLDEALAMVAKIPELEAAIKSFDPVAIQKALDDMLASHTELKASVDAVAVRLPAVEQIVGDIESALPENWKARLTAFLGVAKQHWGI